MRPNKIIFLHGFCSECCSPCKVIPLDNSFSYSGTHCTGGKPGIHRPAGYGEPVSDCCEAPCVDETGFEITEFPEPDYDY